MEWSNDEDVPIEELRNSGIEGLRDWETASDVSFFNGVFDQVGGLLYI